MRRSLRRLALAGTLCGAVALGVPVATAETVSDDQARVLDVIAPVLDVNLNSSDLKGEARVEEAPHRVTVRLDSTVLFAKDSPRLLPGARARLTEVAEQLKRKGPGSLRIVGYTDDLGSAHHGLVLSRQRAASVAAALRPRLKGGDYSFTVLGKGEADPAVPNDSEAHRRINRRVELTFKTS